VSVSVIILLWLWYYFTDQKSNRFIRFVWPSHCGRPNFKRQYLHNHNTYNNHSTSHTYYNSHTIILYYYTRRSESIPSGGGCNSALLSFHTIHSPFILLSFQQRFHPNISFHHLIFILTHSPFIVFNCIRFYFRFMSFCRLVHSNLFSFSSFCFSAFLSFFFPFLFAFHDADTSRTVLLFSCPRREGTFYLIHQQQQQHTGRCMRVNT